MTQPQIDEARAELAALAADEQELQTLATQKAEEITLLKATGSKDFSALAALEGQRAALQTMLSEQRGYMAAAEARVTALEAEARQAGQVEEARRLAEQILSRRAALDSELLAFVERGRVDLLRLSEIHGDWVASRYRWQLLAGEMGAAASRTHEQRHWDLLTALEAEGVQTAALWLTRFQTQVSIFDKLDPWPLPFSLEYPAREDAAQVLGVLLQKAAIEAIRGGPIRQTPDQGAAPQQGIYLGGL